MRFAEPYWLLVGLSAVALVSALLVRGEILTSRALALLQRARLGSASAAPSRAHRWARIVVTMLAVSFGFVALARPQRGMHWETMARSGVDLLLVVDTSKSMDADDVKPTRLERTKLAIRDLVGRFPADRIGLVAFAGDAFVESPMTLDHTALLDSVDALDTSVIAHGGTNIGRGIQVAAEALGTEPDNQKVMVLLTDGEDLEGQGLAEAKRAADAGIVIDTVGIGTLQGELVPARDDKGLPVGVMHDEAGNPVRSRLDEKDLQALSESTHGTYRALGADGRGLDRLYDEVLAPRTHAEATARTRRVYTELFELPLGLALLGIVVDALLGRLRKSKSGKRARKATPSRDRRALSLAAAVGALLMASPSLAQASVSSAQKAYAAGQFDVAAKELQAESDKDPKDARLAFDAGDAAYRAGRFELAESAFQRALTVASPALQQRVLYNQGDVLYRMGDAQKPEAREERIARWKSAIESYDGALSLDPKDEDARYNRDLVARKLAALTEPPKQDPKDDPKKQDPKQNQDSKSGSGNDPKKGPKSGDGSKGSEGTKGSSGAQGEKGSQPEPNDKPGEKPGDKPNDKPGETKQAGNAPPTPNPLNGNQGNKGNQGNQGNVARGDDDAKSPSDKLSPREARALLGSLRGDEPKGVHLGTARVAPTDDTPGKDW